MKLLRSLALALGLALGLAPAHAVVQSTVMRNANLTVPPAAYAVSIINAFSAPRTLTLPSASSTNIGNSGAITYYQNALVVYDTVGAITGSNTLTIAAASGETINGASTLVVSTTNAIITIAPTSGTTWAATVSGPGTSVVPATTCPTNQWINAIAATGAGTCTATGTVVTSGKTVTFGNTMVFSGFTDGATLSPGQYIATATNDAATAGNIGELLSSTVASGSAVALTSTVAADVTTLALTAGDWDMSGQVCTVVAGGTTTSMVEFGANTSTALPTRGLNQSYLSNGAVGANLASCGSFGPFRVSLSGPATYHLVAAVTFAVSTESAYGIIRARRMR